MKLYIVYLGSETVCPEKDRQAAFFTPEAVLGEVLPYLGFPELDPLNYSSSQAPADTRAVNFLARCASYAGGVSSQSLGV